MAIETWNPWREFDSLQERINRMFEQTLGGRRPSEREQMVRGIWTPAIDIQETDDSYIVKADLPGVGKDDIHVDLRDNVLTIRGEKKYEEEASRDNYIRKERLHGTFTRSLMLPQNVDADKIQANYKDGVLELTIPKKEGAKPKEIEINTPLA